MAEFVANFNLNNNNLDASFDLSEGASFDALFEIYAGSVTWGNILGDITNQTDLQNALNSKASNERVDGIVEAFDNDIESINDSITELSGNLDDLESTVTDNYNELNSAIDSNHQAISNINSTIQSYGDIVTYNASYFATSAQGELADTALQPGDVNNSRITIQKNGSSVGDFTLNQASDETININVPTTAADVGALPDTTTINDLTTTAQQEALNSGANTTNIGQISANAQAIQTETTNRENADNNLQSQIDAITAASDVTDIVGTYAELQAYDTTNLPNNSIIKVLQDESRDDETTYYRWVITGGVGAWVLIGEEGPYYTKSEADSTFVPQTRTINGKALSSNINLDASDVGALPDSTIIPTVNNATLTIQKNGTNVQSFTANASSDVTANITVPTDTSDLTNGAGFITAASLPTVNNGTLTIQANGTTVGTFTANQVGNTTANIVVPDSAIWGNITGNISNQTDLQNALDDKQDTLVAGTDLEIVNVSSQGLPDGYTLLEWVESSGLQNLSLGFSGNCTIEFTVQMAHVPTNNEVLLTSSVNAAAGTWFGVNSDNTWSYSDISGSIKINVVMNATAQGLNGTINSNTFSRNVPVTHGTWTLFNNIPVQSGATTYPSFMKLFALKVTQNGVVIRNLVPCKNNNNVVGLYDTINSVFYFSTSGTQLIAGTVIPTGNVINFTNDSGYIKSASVNTLTDVTLSNLTNGQGLIYNSTSQKWENQNISTGGGTWGSITGTLSNQTDLQNALNGKMPFTDLGTISLEDYDYDYFEYIKTLTNTGNYCFTEDMDGFSIYVLVQHSGDGIYQYFWSTEEYRLYYQFYNGYEWSDMQTIATNNDIVDLINGSCVKFTSQNLTEQQKNIARNNINAERTPIDLGDITDTVENDYEGDWSLYVVELADGRYRFVLYDMDYLVDVKSAGYIKFVQYIDTDDGTTLGQFFYDGDEFYFATPLTLETAQSMFLPKSYVPFNIVSTASFSDWLDNVANNNLGWYVVTDTTAKKKYLVTTDYYNVSSPVKYYRYQTYFDYDDPTTIYRRKGQKANFNTPTVWQAWKVFRCFDELVNYVDGQVHNGTLTITQDGNTLGTFTANQSENTTVDIPSGGSSRNIGEIVESTIPLTDAGLHLLDGALISGSGSYSAFVDYIADIYDGGNYPDLFDTEANWQSAVTQYGVCGKFVYDSANNTVRLPKITGIVEGTTDVTALGDLVEAGLPNITGSVYNSSTNAGDQFSDIATVSSLGALSDIRSTVGRYGITNGTTTYTNMWDGISFDASNSNATYGNSSTVQPQTIKVLYYIAIATSAKTQIQVDIDEIATDLNGKADRDGSNMVNSVKNFDGDWVHSFLRIAQSVSVSTSADQTYSLSSYLPNDGYNYEVLVGVNVSISTNSKFCNIYAHTDLFSEGIGIVGGSKSGTTYGFYSCGSAVLPVGMGRTITILKGSSTSAEGTYTINVYGYRRIGTNQ